MRTLAIDPGARRIGLAISDEGGNLATAYQVLTVSNPDQAIAQIAQVIARESIARLVVGLPLNMDGSMGPAAQGALAFARRLQDQTGIRALLVDERLSSFRAQEQLSDRRGRGEKLTRKRKKEQRDALAAAAFLQDFLDGKVTPLQL